MKLIRYLLWTLVVVIGVSFAGLNAQMVHFNYYINDADLPLSLLLALTFAVGALLGVLASLLIIIKCKKDNAHLRRELERRVPDKASSH